MLIPSRVRRCLLAGWLLLLVIGWHVPDLSAQQFIARHYTVDDGLPSGVVRAIQQGPDGELWFATRSGVARYDGSAWSVYNLGHGFRAADQVALAWDAAGVLWSLATQEPFDLYRFDGEAWHAEQGPGAAASGRTPTAFCTIETPHGPDFLVGTDDGLYHRSGGSWRHWSVASGLPHPRVVGVDATEHAIVVATTGGLATFEGQHFAPVGPAVLPGPLTAFARENPSTQKSVGVVQPRWWLAGPGWLGTWRPGGVLELMEPAGSSSLQATQVSLLPDQRGGAFVVRDGVLTWTRPAREQAGDGKLLSSLEMRVEDPRAMYLDRENNLWIARRGGVSKLVRRPFTRLASRDGLLDDEVTAIVERADGTLVFGHPGGLTMVAEDGNIATRSWGATVNLEEHVWALAENDYGELLIAGGRNGLGRMGVDDTLRWYGAESGLFDSVTAVAVDSIGGLWIGTERGLYRDTGQHRFVAVGGEAGSAHIRSVLTGSSGSVVLSTARGLMVLGASGVAHYKCRAPAGCDSLFSALETPDGGYWVGTSAGLYQTAPDALVPTVSPAIGRPVYSVFRDAADRVWFGTDNGVLQWDGKTLRSFTTRDGLAGRETNRAAWLVDRRGRVWVGTEGGASVLREGAFGKPGVAPLVMLDHLTVAAGEPQPLSEPNRFRYDENDLTFRVRAVSMIDEPGNRVASKLEGFDDGWSVHPAGRAVEVRYTNLSPGRYRFSAKASNTDGVWSDQQKSADIVIAKPFWLETWFHLVTAVLLGSLAFSARRLVSNSRYARRLEQEVEERVAEVFTEKERLAVTLRNIDDGVLTTDAEGAVIFLNPVAQELVGYRPGAAIGRPLSEVMVLRMPIGDHQVYDPFKLLVARDIEALERPVTVELSPLVGEPRLVEVSGSPIVASRSQFAGLVLAFRDITERQRIDQELAKGRRLEALGLLAGGIAHDFNNLLTVMLGSLSMVDQGGAMADPQKKLLRATESAVLRARDLTQQLLTFSQGGAPVRAAAAIAEVVRESASFVLSGANVRAEIELPNDLWVVEIDAGQINQVINNLLINATQAMPEGGVVRIGGSNVLGATIPLPRERYVLLSVVDQGVGIPADCLDRIFDPYFSTKELDPYFSTKEQGRGLGLASAYSIAKRHDGLLTVRSTPGKGTSFHLYLPASNALATDLESPRRVQPERAGRILIMDDDEAVRGMMGAMVRKLGYEVLLTADGAAAVSAYRAALGTAHRFDAVIMDLTVRGGMGGKEATRRLLAIDPETRAIVASGYSNDPVMANHGRYGFLGRISKPFPPEELGFVLAEVLAIDPADLESRRAQEDRSARG